MRLSMWILADWLKDYHPQAKIQDGKCVLRNARLFSEAVRLESMDVFIGSMKDFSFENNNKMICVQGHDMMLLDTEDGDEILNVILDAFDYYNNWSDKLRAAIRDGAALQTLLDESEEIFGFPLLVCDPGYYVIAQAGMDRMVFDNARASENLAEMKKNGVMPMKTIVAINADERIRVNSRSAYLMEYEELGSPIICRNLYSQNCHVGWVLVILRKENITRGLMQLLDELGDIIEYWSDFNSKQKELLSYNDLFQNILTDPDADVQKQAKRLRSIGWYPEDPKQMIVLERQETDLLSTEYFRRKIDRIGNGCFTVTAQDPLALILNRRIISYREFLEELKDLMRQTDMWGGISPEFTNVFGMKEPLELASSASRLGSHEVGSLTEFRECALPYALEILREHSSPCFLHPALETLRQYDKKNHTELFLTLREFLNCERNYIRTAGRLYIHRNTLLYRLKRITDLTGVELDSESVRLHLQLSYLLCDEACP